MTGVESVLVIGGGIGGLATAAAFGQRGYQVELTERRSEAHALGVGINQPANSLRVLRSLGVLDEILESGCVYDRLRFYDRNGRVAVEVPSKLGGDVPANCALSRVALANALEGAARKAHAKLKYGVFPTEITPESDGVRVSLSDGSSSRFDLVVSFDGLHSQTRQRFFGAGLAPQFTGYAVWRVTVPRPASVDCCQLYHGVHTKAGVIPISNTHMYLLLVCAEPGDARYGQEQYGTLLRGRLNEYTGLIAQIRDELKDDDDIVYSPVHEVFVPEPWHRGRVVIGGDAVHASAPHLTQGAAMALEDAAVLAELIDRDVEPDVSLREYALRRLPRVRLVQEVSRAILKAEMSVTPTSYARSLEALREELPTRLGAVEAVLNQAA